jgi:hypothetical protein
VEEARVVRTLLTHCYDQGSQCPPWLSTAASPRSCDCGRTETVHFNMEVGLLPAEYATARYRRTPQGRFPPARLLHPGAKCAPGHIKQDPEPRSLVVYNPN